MLQIYSDEPFLSDATFEMGDFDGDKKVGLSDLAILQAHLNGPMDRASANRVAIPEPSTYLLFAVGILGIFGMGYRQRKKAA